MRAQAPLLEFQHVSKDFFGNRVLSEVSFSLVPGQRLGLVGENGAGKSTLMRILFGMPVIHATGGYEGKVLLDGREVSFANPLAALDAGIGMVHQEFSLIPGFTATENIVLNSESTRYNFLVELFGDRLRTLDRETMKQRSLAAIAKLGVNLQENMLVSEMPVGHKQFTEIARELDRQNIRLLVLDEPTAVLTESEAKILLDSVRLLSEEGIAVIFISHRLDEIISLCDTCVVLRDGRVVVEKRTAETSVVEIAEYMVGRSLEEAGATARESGERETILSVEHLWVDMPGETVRDVNFDVYRGEIFGIGGLAGQGKLGIPNGIMGLYAAGGSVHLKSSAVELNDPRAALNAGMAFVAEDRRGVGLLLEEPIDCNISFTAMQVQDRFISRYLGGLIKWRDDRAVARVAREYIEQLQIKCTSEKQPAQELSGGNQQKVCLAKAFAVRPEILLVSEPTRGIDVGAKELVLATLRRYNHDYGTTILMISSELEELRSVCDRVAIVNEGRIAGILPASAPATRFGLLMVGRTEANPHEEKSHGQA
jgi:simple sugar transport system ATP-binding protein